eukprot:5068179-Amphidinium_carterae.1
MPRPKMGAISPSLESLGCETLRDVLNYMDRRDSFSSYVCKVPPVVFPCKYVTTGAIPAVTSQGLCAMQKCNMTKGAPLGIDDCDTKPCISHIDVVPVLADSDMQP